MSNKIPLFAFIITNVIIIILLSILVFNTIFFDNTENVSNSIVKNTNNKTYSAEKIINLMKEKSNTIGKIVVYTEETDLNKLLGRPNQYTSKIQFADNRLDQSLLGENDAKGGTIEVFESKEDLENRKRYIEAMSSQSSLFAEYIYSNDYAMLRLDFSLTPEQAKEYKELFYECIK